MLAAHTSSSQHPSAILFQSRCLLRSLSSRLRLRLRLRCARFDGYLTGIALRLRSWNTDFQNSVLEFGARLVSLNAFRQSNRPVEMSITAFRSLNATFVLLLYELSFAPDDDGIIRDLDGDIIV